MVRFGRGLGRLLPRVALAVVVSASGVLIGTLIGNRGAGTRASGQPDVTLAREMPDPRAADRKRINALALAYQEALDPSSRRDPCGSLALGAAASTLIVGDPERGLRGCTAVIRARDAGLAGARPAGVTDVRFVGVSGLATGYATVPGAQATWRADAKRSVTFIRERNSWVIAS